jgi:preprotein translocase subunit SecF
MLEKYVPKEIPFMRYQLPFMMVSAIVVAVSLFLLFTRGLNYGTDFRGGLTLIYQIEKPATEKEVTDLLAEKGVPSFVVQRFGEAKQGTFVIKSDLPEGKAEEFSKPFTDALTAAFAPAKVTMMKEEFVGPKVGAELRRKGIYAVIWAWVIMLIYIGFRFDFYFAPGAIIALIHDIIVPLGAFALTQREVNLTVLAAFLTIVGYSINDTIIIFDRIRENLKKHKGMPLEQIANQSLTQVLVRSIVTSVTVFFVVVVLFFRAEGDIQNFAFAMIWGVIAGSYSTIFIATPVWLFLRKHGHRFGFKSKHTKVVTS